jgi:hypothetical protein
MNLILWSRNQGALAKWSQGVRVHYTRDQNHCLDVDWEKGPKPHDITSRAAKKIGKGQGPNCKI